MLNIKQFESWLQNNLSALSVFCGKRDWVRTIRTSKGLKSRELAERMGVSPARISVIERDESTGSLTVKMLERTADSLDCELVYLLVPKHVLKQVHSRDNKPRIRSR